MVVGQEVEEEGEDCLSLLLLNSSKLSRRVCSAGSVRRLRSLEGGEARGRVEGELETELHRRRDHCWRG